MLAAIKKLFLKVIGGSRNERIIKARMKIVREEINPLEDRMRALDTEEMAACSRALKERLQNGENRRVVLPEAFALVREASRRARDHRQFDVQLAAGMILDEGWVAEEATGEGKTIACYPAIYMAWLEGMKTHLITVNDVLVKRDADFAAPVFALLGMSVGYIVTEMSPSQRKPMYACDLTYGTNSEFGFDYLRDNMKLSVEEQVQGGLEFAIVDEVDSILIDEARTPLIISGGAHGDISRFKKADAVARELIRRNRPHENGKREVERLEREIKSLNGELGKAAKGAESEAIRRRIEEAERSLEEAERARDECTQMYEVELDKKSVHMTHEGVGVAQDIAGVGSFYVGANMEWPHLMEQALRAHLVYERDKEYVVKDGNVVIVDEFTGRLLEGRQWSDGLHQAVEAKENVRVKEETQTLATITLQNFFNLYDRLAGMTGTAMTEAEEFQKIYSLDCASVPTNEPCIRDDRADLIYASKAAKYKAIVEEIRSVSHDEGRPVLVGTTSIEKSELISDMLLKQYGIEHQVLNGRVENAARENDIVKKAGRQHPVKQGSANMVGTVTIATNMAGRGTDIKLGEGVAAIGGLHIVGTERHESRRIDNQLRGRSGRQGDPGSSRFFLSLEDDLMSIFASEFMLKVLGKMGFKGDEVIESKMVSRGIERAQKKVEQRNFDIRKNLLEYDEVMNHQRKNLYGMRQRILEGQDLQDLVRGYVEEAVDEAVDSYLDGNYARRCIAEWAGGVLQLNVDEADVDADSLQDLPDLEQKLRGMASDEAQATISITLGEYMDESLDRKQWDFKGLSKWMMSRFDVQVSQNRLRKMEIAEVEELLAEKAEEQIAKTDFSPLVTMLEDDFARKSLADWFFNKFDATLDLRELAGEQDEVRAFLHEKVEQLYRRRTIEYPVQTAIDSTIAQAGTENVYALDKLVRWANRKYEAGLSPEDLQGRKIADVYRQLVGLSEEWNAGDRLERCVRDALGAAPSPDEAAAFCRRRFYTDAKPESLGRDGEIIDNILLAGRRFLRREMSELERVVLLQIIDASWKDHLLAMDHLKGSIGLRGFAEQDPKVAYKREGGRLFDDMFSGIREKVTDMIFRVRLSSDFEMESVYQITDHEHESMAGYDHFRDERDAAMAGKGPKAAPITRDEPKVGRNDPCPCGSGKKYKKCCMNKAAAV